jgi:hypothetical protein
MRGVLPILAIMLLFPMALPACSSRTVEYSRSGDAYCPGCQTRLPGRVIRCTVCGTNLRWAETVGPCWHCDGSGLCQVCNGLGKIKGSDAVQGLDCFACPDKEATRDPNPTGDCPHCDGTGTVYFGGS